MPLIRRFCFSCKRELIYHHFLEVNFKEQAIKMKKVWNNTLLQLFCCECYKYVEELYEMNDSETIEQGISRFKDFRLNRQEGFDIEHCYKEYYYFSQLCWNCTENENCKKRFELENEGVIK